MRDKIIDKIEDLIGNTPLFRPRRWLASQGLSDNLTAKLEGYNATGSVKDRAALGMLLDLEARGLLKEAGTIIEPTSGNTGIALAALAASRGYQAIFVMPETMSVERRKFLQAYGAKVVLTPGELGMKGAIDKANSLQSEIEGAVIPSQFENPANPHYHSLTTGVEIWEQTAGEVKVVIAGVGTGGTISGVAKTLKEKNPEIEIIAVEPNTSAVISAQPAGKHGIQGIGAGFVPGNYNASLVDRVLQISTEAAIREAQAFARKEGLFVGISSGAALAAGLLVMEDSHYKDKLIVCVLPDLGDRYLSTALLED